jgi:hypothetical protein
MSLFSMSLIGSTPIGGPLVGWLGDHASPRVALLVGAAGAFAAAAYGYASLVRSQSAPVLSVDTLEPVS